jgi:hypothetical protein
MRLRRHPSNWFPGQTIVPRLASEMPTRPGALAGHLDHSCVPRDQYDEALRAVGHWRWRARDAERQLAELRKEAA